MQAANTNLAVDDCPAGGGEDTILLSTGTYFLTLSRLGNDSPELGDLDLLGPVRIIGAGEDKTVLHANGIDRGLEIHEGVSVFLAHLSVTGGHPSRSEDGGGILNRGTLVAESVRLHDNQAGDGDSPSANGGSGGGLANLGRATLILADIYANVPGNGYDDPSPYPSPDDSDPGTGGGVYNSGELLLRDSTVQDNRGGLTNIGNLVMANTLFAQNTEASALINEGSASISHSRFLQNSTYDGQSRAGAKMVWGTDGGDGGAIYNRATLTMTHSTITQNRAGDGMDGHHWHGWGGNGGGIYNSGALMLDSCLIASNRAGDGGEIWADAYDPESNGGSGGGIYSHGILTITNSTISGNRAGNAGYPAHETYPVNVVGSGGFGGGIYVDNAHIRFSTIVSNSSGMGTSSEEESGEPGQGGGVFSDGAISLTGVVFVGQGSPAHSPSCAGLGITSLGYNLFEESQGCAITGTLAHTSTDILDQSALLGPLADNGGPTLSHLPTAASPAVDAVPASAWVAVDGAPIPTDQRGVMRPQGSAWDMGSVERGMSTLYEPQTGASLDYTGENGESVTMVIPAGAFPTRMEIFYYRASAYPPPIGRRVGRHPSGL